MLQSTLGRTIYWYFKVHVEYEGSQLNVSPEALYQDVKIGNSRTTANMYFINKCIPNLYHSWLHKCITLILRDTLLIVQWISLCCLIIRVVVYILCRCVLTCTRKSLLLHFGAWIKPKGESVFALTYGLGRWLELAHWLVYNAL